MVDYGSECVNTLWGSVEAGSFLECVTADQRLKNYSVFDIITCASCHFSVINRQMQTSAAEITTG